MDKNTKLLLGVGLVGVGAYLLMQSKKPKATTSFAGATFNDVVGNRRGFVSELPAKESPFTRFTGAEQLPVADSGWVRADGVQQFYDVQSPNWAKYAGNTQFFDVESKGWVRG
jgi:hypothetical protein